MDWNKQVGVSLTDCFGLIVDEENRQRYMKLKKNTTMVGFHAVKGYQKNINCMISHLKIAQESIAILQFTIRI